MGSDSLEVRQATPELERRGRSNVIAGPHGLARLCSDDGCPPRSQDIFEPLGEVADTVAFFFRKAHHKRHGLRCFFLDAHSIPRASAIVGDSGDNRMRGIGSYVIFKTVDGRSETVHAALSDPKNF